MYYYGARYYDPEIGRFIQADTVLDGLNRYAYCHNNPVMYTDPTGLWIDNGDGSYTAVENDTLWGLEQLTGRDWHDTGFNRDPRTLQVGETVSYNSNSNAGNNGSPDNNNNNSVEPPDLFLPPEERKNDELQNQYPIENLISASGKDTPVSPHARLMYGLYTTQLNLFYIDLLGKFTFGVAPFSDTMESFADGLWYLSLGRNESSSPYSLKAHTPGEKQKLQFGSILTILMTAATGLGAASCTIDDAAGAGNSTINGRRGSPIEIQHGTNTEIKINGRSFTGHALDRMQGRGVLPSVVENTIKKGNWSFGNTFGTLKYYDTVNKTTVITNFFGKVITVY